MKRLIPIFALAIWLLPGCVDNDLEVQRLVVLYFNRVDAPDTIVHRL